MRVDPYLKYLLQAVKTQYLEEVADAERVLCFDAEAALGKAVDAFEAADSWLDAIDTELDEWEHQVLDAEIEAKQVVVAVAMECARGEPIRYFMKMSDNTRSQIGAMEYEGLRRQLGHNH